MRIETFLSSSAERLGGQAAIVAAGRTHSYSQLAAAAQRIAAALIARGVRSGDCVGVLMDNSFAAVAVVFGALTAGATVWFIGKDIAGETLGGALADHHVVALATEARYASRAARALAQAGEVRVVLLSGGDAATSSHNCLSIENLLGRFAPAPPVPDVNAAHDAAVILCGLDAGDDVTRPLVLAHAELIAGAECTAPRHGTILRTMFSFAGFCHLIQAIRTGVAIELAGHHTARRGSSGPSGLVHGRETGEFVPAVIAG